AMLEKCAIIRFQKKHIKPEQTKKRGDMLELQIFSDHNVQKVLVYYTQTCQHLQHGSTTILRASMPYAQVFLVSLWGCLDDYNIFWIHKGIFCFMEKTQMT
ncbi:hypothetical protein ACJX0J_038180, partial [Zea mays]